MPNASSSSAAPPQGPRAEEDPAFALGKPTLIATAATLLAGLVAVLLDHP